MQKWGYLAWNMCNADVEPWARGSAIWAVTDLRGIDVA